MRLATNYCSHNHQVAGNMSYTLFWHSLFKEFYSELLYFILICNSCSTRRVSLSIWLTFERGTFWSQFLRVGDWGTLGLAHSAVCPWVTIHFPLTYRSTSYPFCHSMKLYLLERYLSSYPGRMDGQTATLLEPAKKLNKMPTNWWGRRNAAPLKFDQKPSMNADWKWHQ